MATFTTNNITTTASNNWTTINSANTHKREVQRESMRQLNDPRFPKVALVKNLPLRNDPCKKLTELLQSEFDHWTRNQMRVIRG